MDKKQGPYPDVVHWVGTTGASGGKTAAATSRAGVHALQPRESLKEAFVCLFTFANISNTGILITIFS
jgi:hypothetical protein